MTLKSLLATGLTLAALAVPGMALAQDASAPSAEGDGQILAPSGTAGTPSAAAGPAQNWAKVCEPKGDKKSCLIYQVVVSQQAGQYLGSFVIRDDPTQESRLVATAAVPLGVLLPFKMVWQIDGSVPVAVPYAWCDLRSCTAQIVINEAYVNSLKKGNKLTLQAKNRLGENLDIVINLAGFTATYDGESSLTVEEANKINSGEAALERILQQRAEETAKKLEGGTAPSAVPAPAAQ